MPITQADIVLLASKVMADVPEGGGGPSPNVLQSGVSNNIFEDITEVARTGGNLSLRQIFLAIRSQDTDNAMGSHMIVSQPPADPNVSILLMAAEHDFAVREGEISRLESGFLASGMFNGQLFGQHLAGQRVLMIMMREEAELPAIGARLALVYREGYPDEQTQYVSVQRIASNVIQTFTDDQGDFTRRIVSVEIGQQLARAFPGFDAQRTTIGENALNQRTKIRTTVWAPVARYYGIKALTADANINDFEVRTSGIYERLVPSAEAETPIADARTNQQREALMPAGDGTLSYQTNGTFNVATPLYIGGGIMPGTLSVNSLTDDGGRLMLADQQVGSVDYANGICTLTMAGAAISGTINISYKPAAAYEANTSSVGIRVTAEDRALNYVYTLPSNATPGSLQISYRAQARWYVLHDDGSGRLSGGDVSAGVGNYNRATRTITLSLGALPDVGSAIIINYSRELEADSNATPAERGIVELAHGGKCVIPINSDGHISWEPGSSNIAAGSVNISWSDGETDYTATSDALGRITGDATGTVTAGVIALCPNVLPAPGSNIQVGWGRRSVESASPDWSGSGTSAISALIGQPVAPGGFRATVSLRFTASGGYDGYSDGSETVGAMMTDDGDGNVLIAGIAVGTIDYAAGTLTANVAGHEAALGDALGAAITRTGISTFGQSRVRRAGVSTWAGRASVSCAVQGLGDAEVGNAPEYSTSLLVPVSNIYLAAKWLPTGSTMQGVQFIWRGARYLGQRSGGLVRDINPATGNGTNVGSVDPVTGHVRIDNWQPGANAAVQTWAAYAAPALSGEGELSAELRILFRTAQSPIRPGSLQIVATLEDGTEITASANNAGEIVHARLVGRIDAESGVGELIFRRADAGPLGTYDASGLGIEGVGTINVDQVRASTLRYNAVAYEYIPINPEIVGVDSVRLPSDGRVAIFETGDYVVLHNTITRDPETVTDGQEIDLGRERLSRVTITDATGNAVNHGWARDLDAGTVKILATTDWVQPVRIAHSIEHMAIVREVDISGRIVLNKRIPHHFPAGSSYISGALMLGDRFARVSHLWDQQNWDGVTWVDNIVGNGAVAEYNDTISPIVVTNYSAITQRWAVRFLTSTTFEVIGQDVGRVATGNINEDCAVLDPSTNLPWFIIPALGWGTGWAQGNVVRINTVGALRGFCVIRAVQPGEYTEIDHKFALLARVDVDRPPSDGAAPGVGG